MGLFDKKICDVCGEQIKLLGNRKLEDGNLCKNCASKLSPFFTGRKGSTVAEIKQQLAYREQNKSVLASVRPTLVFGNYYKVYIDQAQQKFFVTAANSYMEENPDVINISDVSSVAINIEEDKEEILREDNQGNKISYNPPRYEVEYEFNVTINVNNPYFSQIEFELSDDDRRPDSPYTDLYRDLERQANELKQALTSGGVQVATATPTATPVGVPVATAAPASSSWTCPSCGATNEGNFCQGCGAPKAIEEKLWFCQNCGQQNTGKFCQGCGQPKK